MARSGIRQTAPTIWYIGEVGRLMARVLCYCNPCSPWPNQSPSQRVLCGACKVPGGPWLHQSVIAWELYGSLHAPAAPWRVRAYLLPVKDATPRPCMPQSHRVTTTVGFFGPPPAAPPLGVTCRQNSQLFLSVSERSNHGPKFGRSTSGATPYEAPEFK